MNTEQKLRAILAPKNFLQKNKTCTKIAESASHFKLYHICKTIERFYRKYRFV